MTVDVDSLHIIAEVAASLAGFAAVMTGLGARSKDNQVSSFNKVRLYHMLGTATIVVVFALVPTWLQRIGLVGTDIWFFSTLVLIGMASIVVALIFGVSRVNLKKVRGTSWVKGSILILVVQVLLLLLMLSPWPFESSQSIYEMMLICGLANMAYTFANMIVESEIGGGDA